MGFDSSDPLLSAIDSGKVDGSILQDPYKIGLSERVDSGAAPAQLEGGGGARLLGGVEAVSAAAELSDPYRLGLLGTLALMPSLEACDPAQAKTWWTGEHVITQTNRKALSTRNCTTPRRRPRVMLRPVYLKRR